MAVWKSGKLFIPWHFKQVTEPIKGVMHTTIFDFSNKTSTVFITNFDQYYTVENEQYDPVFFSMGQRSGGSVNMYAYLPVN